MSKYTGCCCPELISTFSSLFTQGSGPRPAPGLTPARLNLNLVNNGENILSDAAFVFHELLITSLGVAFYYKIDIFTILTFEITSVLFSDCDHPNHADFCSNFASPLQLFRQSDPHCSDKCSSKVSEP